ncbi:GNAT family N-acetyltransferase [Microbacterium bovistercoris]|uniref:GNAT family N-acetyltransferase n=1 Tax=Microbacterium bovistercoris TaxID=2293570 RepID=A0A371NRJ7_9MICO|nr:GNAT family N-acetyltransferase [Microbacterium bovistercoris]REJ04796.1 GNAT family N-acetyltransferase [Microbacterium bovistercoris]
MTATPPVHALPAGATLRPLVLPERADAGPSPLIREYAEVRNRSILESTGRDDDALSAESLLPVLYSTPDRVRHQWYVELEGRIVGCCPLDILQDDGGRTAFVTVALLRDVQGRGIGRAAYDLLESIARERGVRKLVHFAEHRDDGAGASPIASPTGFGSVPADRAARFLIRNGYTLETVERASEFVWTDGAVTDLESRRAEAADHASAYRIVQWMLPTPAEYVDGYAWMKSRMSTDVPEGDLGLPEEAWDAARVAQQDERVAAKGFTQLVTAAQHVGTGELCAFNELAIGPAESGATHQWDTLVLADHRGHRLGMLVKTAGLLAWHERHPDSPRVITYNSEQNRPMLSINEALGFTAFTYEGAWKKELS